ATLTFGMDLSDFNQAMRAHQGRASLPKRNTFGARLPKCAPSPARTQKSRQSRMHFVAFIHSQPQVILIN
ncbi:MAG: hypothetical protein ACTTH5_02370, partial [Wolinella sp.]